jgi:hypothetical protein
LSDYVSVRVVLYKPKAFEKPEVLVRNLEGGALVHCAVVAANWFADNRLTKMALPYKLPRTLYVVESPHQIAWEENHGAVVFALIFQIPKP